MTYSCVDGLHDDPTDCPCGTDVSVSVVTMTEAT